MTAPAFSISTELPKLRHVTPLVEHYLTFFLYVNVNLVPRAFWRALRKRLFSQLDLGKEIFCRVLTWNILPASQRLTKLFPGPTWPCQQDFVDCRVPEPVVWYRPRDTQCQPLTNILMRFHSERIVKRWMLKMKEYNEGWSNEELSRNTDDPTLTNCWYTRMETSNLNRGNGQANLRAIQPKMRNKAKGRATWNTWMNYKEQGRGTVEKMANCRTTARKTYIKVLHWRGTPQTDTTL